MKNVSRVKEQSSTTGLSSYSLSSSGVLYRRFRDEFATGERVRYMAVSAADFEEGIGILATGAPDVLSRDTIIRSSQSGAKINWSAGTRDLFVDPLPGTAPIADKAGAYTITAQDHGGLLRFTGSSGATLTLIAAAAAGDGFSFEVWNSGTADWTIDPSGAETINGATTLVVSPTRGVLVRCNGAAWYAHPTGSPSPAAIVANSRNLVAAYASASTLTVTADEVVLKDSSGAAFLASSVSVTANIATAGANGLDTGSEASSTWYYVWLIYNGTTVAALLSASSSAPTMPSGYTYKALVSVVRNDGSSNFIRFWQNDRRLGIATQNVFTAFAATAAGTYQSLSLTAFVPPIARFVSGSVGGTVSSGGFGVAVAGDANGVGAQYVSATTHSTALDVYVGAGAFTDVPLIVAQQVHWKSRNTSAENRLDVSGFVI